jgi:hypothetical protein
MIVCAPIPPKVFPGWKMVNDRGKEGDNVRKAAKAA